MEYKYNGCNLGRHISDVVKDMIAQVKELELTDSVSCLFNEIKICVNHNSSVEEVVSYFLNAIEERRKIYEESDEYKKYLIEKMKQVCLAKDIVTKAIDQLQQIDYNNLKEVLNWFYHVQDSLDMVGSSTRDQLDFICKTFVSKGFIISDKVRKIDEYSSLEDKARWIIGQCLSGINVVGSPHPICKKFIDDWILEDSM